METVEACRQTQRAHEQSTQDRRAGRVLMLASRRERLLDEFEESGVSGGVRFAQMTGLKYQALAARLQARRGRTSTVARPRPAIGAAISLMTLALKPYASTMLRGVA